ncbi:MAG: ketoacyl-ACP synthase III [Oscillospiraceae bacterium]|nr:ketoacyl-ACP synthase III [Oscillospiraceae bacterium]
MYAKLSGMGKYVPEKICTNADLEKIVDTSDEWITTRTGIKERRFADENTYTSDIAAKAAVAALAQANIAASEVELIIVATVTADMLTPNTACLVQNLIGANKAVCFDINAACSGFIYALTVANQFIKSGAYKNALVIGAECLSKVTEFKDRDTCVLFGDGAGASVLTATTEETGILATHLGADGASGNVLTIGGIREDDDKSRRPHGNPRTVWMDGSEVFKFAVRVMADELDTIMGMAGKTIDDVDLIVPHQANIRIIDGAVKRLKCDKNKVFTNLHKYGNMSAASIPIALCEAMEEGRLKEGDLFALVGFGGGLTWGSAVIRA